MKLRIRLDHCDTHVYEVADDVVDQTDNRVDRFPPALKTVDGRPIVALAPGDKVWSDSLGIQVPWDVVAVERLPDDQSDTP